MGAFNRQINSPRRTLISIIILYNVYASVTFQRRQCASLCTRVMMTNKEEQDDAAKTNHHQLLSRYFPVHVLVIGGSFQVSGDVKLSRTDETYNIII